MKYEDLKESLDAVWNEHAKTCASCGQFDPEKTATLALVCLKGAPPHQADSGARRARRSLQAEPGGQ